jgi:hypothetical protein
VRAASNWEMVADWRFSPWGGGGDDDGGGRKRAEDRGGLIADVDEMRARLAVSGGERGREKERRARRRRVALF